MLVAAMMRTSTRRGVVSPSGVNSRSCMTRSRLARDEHGRARGRDLIDELEDGLHALGAADDAAALETAAEGAAERLSFFILAPPLDAGRDGRHNLFVLKRLADDVECAALPSG